MRKTQKTMRLRADNSNEPPANPGCLIGLVGPEEHGRDLLIATARRRFADNPNLVFPVLVTTRPQTSATSHLHVNRRIFRELLADGGFAATWNCSGHEFALGSEADRSLRAGRNVIVPLPVPAAQSVLTKWPRRIAVEIGARPHRLSRGAGVAAFSGEAYHAIFHAGDLALAVARFRSILDDIAANDGTQDSGNQSRRSRSSVKARPTIRRTSWSVRS